ncbi:MAG: glutathione S-transferase [Sphingomonadales bacterium]|nr:MAG: glutathione S-transferase [Sphingomonadales bacterium]
MRARMALVVRGEPFEIREIVLRSKPAEMLAASPKGTVPVLVLASGRVIDESLHIMRWALHDCDPEDWLAGDDAVLIDLFDDRFKYHLDRYKYAERHDADPAEHRGAGLALLATLEHRLALHANLCRDTRSFADIAIMPFVRQFAAVDRDWFDSQAIPRVVAWLDGHIASPLFEQAFARLKPWEAGAAPVCWPA